MVFGVFGIHEEVSLFMITNPIRHPLPFTLKTLCFIHPFWTNCSYPSECDDMKTWLISVLLMLITVPSVVKRRRNGTRLSLNWPRHIKPASLLWQSYNIRQSLKTYCHQKIGAKLQNIAHFSVMPPSLSCFDIHNLSRVVILCHRLIEDYVQNGMYELL